MRKQTVAAIFAPMVRSLFSTSVCEGVLGDERLRLSLLKDIQSFAEQDRLGHQWSKENYRRGYTSYASLSDLPLRAPSFSHFEEKMRPQASLFCKKLGWNLKGLHLKMDTCWMNIMSRDSYHSSHFHPFSVLSGTYYVSAPRGSAPLRLEDPRLSLYMNAPVRERMPLNGLFHEIQPKEDSFVLFESWLRHEVPLNESMKPRVSLSFNYSLEEKLS